MGTLSFHLPAVLTPAMRWCLDRAAVVDTNDVTPVPTRRAFVNGQLLLSKDTTDSVYVAAPWPVQDYGCPLVRTGTLRERTGSYNLLLELARGQLCQLRNRAAYWQQGGLSIDPDVGSALSAATRRFGRAVADPEAADFTETVEGVLASVYDLGDRLTRAYADHLLADRVATGGPIPTRLSVRLAARPSVEESALVADTFTAVRLCPDWRLIEPTEADYHWADFDEVVEWAVGTGLPLSVGPLIDLDRGVPEWLDPWVGDLPSLAAFVCDFVETCVRRYQTVVPVWEVFRGFNHADALGLGEDDRLRLAARLLESTRNTAPDAEFVITVTRPFGDYLTADDLTYSPYVFADTLLRAGYRLSAVNLDLTDGGGTDAGLTRDPLEVARILEHFGTLGVPLETTHGPPADAPTADAVPVRNDAARRWTDTSMALAAASSQVRAVHWDAAAVTIGRGSPLDSLRAMGTQAALAELRPHLS